MFQTAPMSLTRLPKNTFRSLRLIPKTSIYLHQTARRRNRVRIARLGFQLLTTAVVKLMDLGKFKYVRICVGVALASIFAFILVIRHPGTMSAFVTKTNSTAGRLVLPNGPLDLGVLNSGQ